MNRPVFPAKQAWFILELYTPTYDENACYVTDLTVVINNVSEFTGLFMTDQNLLAAESNISDITIKTDNETNLIGITDDNVSDFTHEC